MEELLAAILEIVFQFVLEMIFELAAEALGGLLDEPKNRGPVGTATGLMFGGALAGLISAWLLPSRLIATRIVIPGASFLLAPLATGLAMHLLGKRLRRLERGPTSLATFRGGALFAFSMALVRWWLVGLPH